MDGEGGTHPFDIMGSHTTGIAVIHMRTPSDGCGVCLGLRPFSPKFSFISSFGCVLVPIFLKEALASHTRLGPYK